MGNKLLSVVLGLIIATLLIGCWLALYDCSSAVQGLY